MVDAKELRDLMEYVAKSGFAEFELEQEGLKLKLVKESARASAPAGNPFPGPYYPMPYPPPVPPGAAAAAPSAASPPSSAAAASASPSGEIYQVTSPMVGTFYRSPNPSAAPYVEVGSVVKKGQVLCIVEAMKLMNEIESEVSGEILEIPVANGQPVEYGEVLFRIRLAS
jgi:acetyl-CoA carboxylase biotin carboxyl carrier protein